jgi:hypothetical protein
MGVGRRSRRWTQMGKRLSFKNFVGNPKPCTGRRLTAIARKDQSLNVPSFIEIVGQLDLAAQFYWALRHKVLRSYSQAEENACSFNGPQDDEFLEVGEINSKLTHYSWFPDA